METNYRLDQQVDQGTKRKLIVRVISFVDFVVVLTQSEGYIFRFLATNKPRDGLHEHYDVGTEYVVQPSTFPVQYQTNVAPQTG